MNLKRIEERQSRFIDQFNHYFIFFLIHEMYAVKYLG